MSWSHKNELSNINFENQTYLKTARQRDRDTASFNSKVRSSELYAA